MNSKQVVLTTGSSTGFGRLFTETPGSQRAHGFRDDARPRRPQRQECVRDSVRWQKRVHCRYTSLNWMSLTTPRSSGLRMPPSPKPAASTSPLTMPDTTSRGWRKLSPPNRHGVLWIRIFLDRFGVNRAVLPHMRRQCSGVLMHVSSGAGRAILPSAGFY